MAVRDWRWPRPELGWWLEQGLTGGVAAGLALGLFEVVVVGPETSARVVAAVIAGAPALDPAYPLGPAIVLGLALHLVLSAAFGVFFGAVMSGSELTPSTAIVVLTGGLYGLVLWIVNVYAVATLARWVWFQTRLDPAVQLVAHVVFFGAVLGWALDRALEARRARAAANERHMLGAAPPDRRIA